MSISYQYQIPENVNRKKLWLQNIGLNENINLNKYASVCSLYFKEEDINRTLRENTVS